MASGDAPVSFRAEDASLLQIVPAGIGLGAILARQRSDGALPAIDLLEMPCTQAQADAISPLALVDADFPPTMIAHGTADLLIRPINSRRLADELARLGVISELVEFAECNHEFDAAPSYAVAVVAHIDVFLRRVLHEPTLAAEMRQYSMFRWQDRRMPFAPVNGQRLFFEDGGGDKPAVVLSHGNLMNRWMWAPQIEALRTEFRCLVWDERLHGHTEDDHALYTYWDSAADLLGLMDHLDIDRAALVGHSQGGFLSLRAALLAPDRVTALVLIDTAGAAWPPEALVQMRGISDGFRTGGPAAVAASLLDTLLGDPDIYDDWLRSWRQQPNDRLADAVAVLMGVDDIAARLGEISQPALVVHGEADQPVPLQLGQMLRDALPHAVDLVVVPGAGHTPSLTHAEQVNPALAAFLRQYC